VDTIIVLSPTLSFGEGVATQYGEIRLFFLQVILKIYDFRFLSGYPLLWRGAGGEDKQKKKMCTR
jgi:hypothetical protein